MRIIKESEELDTLVKVGDIVRLEGFTDDPVIAVVTRSQKGNGCSGCALRTELGCSVMMRDNKGTPHTVSPCCLRTSWMHDGRKAIFGIFKKLDDILEDL